MPGSHVGVFCNGACGMSDTPHIYVTLAMAAMPASATNISTCCVYDLAASQTVSHFAESEKRRRKFVELRKLNLLAADVSKQQCSEKCFGRRNVRKLRYPRCVLTVDVDGKK